jgi:membrane protein DedA with SNARE-associated domain
VSVEPFTDLELARVLVVSALSTFVSEDLTCAAVGALVGQGRLGFVPGALACFAGIFVGDLLLFLAGRCLGAWALARAPLRWFLDPERVAQCGAWLERRGPLVIFLTRFLPGTRLPTYFASGALGTRLARFLPWFALAALVWTPLLVGLAAGVGGALEQRLHFLRDHAFGLVGATLAVVALALALVRRLATARGRGFLRSSWRRAVRFEYWPAWALYAPIVVHITWLALRHGGLRTCTAVNPAFPLGGLVGESKGAILRGLSASGRVPPTATIPAAGTLAERRAQLLVFQARHGLSFPLVLKPDVGERGRGVVVARSLAEAECVLANEPGALLVQAFVPGLEFGLFYARHPDEPAGRILSLTEKHLPSVTGDGRSTLEQLLFADPRTLGMARFHLSAQAPRLAWTPAAGEHVALGDLGTHCRGATFLDGAHLRTPALELALEHVSRTLPGFHFGRYDVRAESPEALAAGRFHVLELNGLTSESTHIYDPRHTLLEAWRDLGRQWTLAFEIGAANVHSGVRAAPWREILHALHSHRSEHSLHTGLPRPASSVKSGKAVTVFPRGHRSERTDFLRRLPAFHPDTAD